MTYDAERRAAAREAMFCDCPDLGCWHYERVITAFRKREALAEKRGAIEALEILKGLMELAKYHTREDCIRLASELLEARRK